MKISALVVTYNDERHLEESLASLILFDELVVVDLGSRDRSVEIANSFGINPIQHPWAPAIELILPEIIQLPRNDWVLRIDPDEVLSRTLVDDLQKLELNDEYGLVAIPFQYLFLNKKLDVTVWGGINYGHRVFHKERTTFDTQVHRTHQCIDGFKEFSVEFKGDNFVTHYWIDSYSQLISKHERYLKLEGQARFADGGRFSAVKMIWFTLIQFKAGFIDKAGWRGGWTGWFLSFFYALYEARAHGLLCTATGILKSLENANNANLFPCRCSVHEIRLKDSRYSL